MIVTLHANADTETVRRALTGRGLWIKRFEAGIGTPAQYLVQAGSSAVTASQLRSIPGVVSVATCPSPHPRLDRQASTVDLGGIAIGQGADPVLIAGPCSVESADGIRDIAARLASRGIRVSVLAVGTKTSSGLRRPLARTISSSMARVWGKLPRGTMSLPPPIAITCRRIISDWFQQGVQ